MKPHEYDKPILVLGAGQIGEAVFTILKLSGFRSIKILDREPKLEWSKDHFILTDDFLDDPDKYLKGCGYCINTLPIYDRVSVLLILHACVVNNVHYLDITEDVRVSKIFQDYCGNQERLNSIVAPHCGLAPGLVQIIAQDYASQFDAVRDIKMYVGALPMSCSNDLGYHVTWSAEGVINEYSNRARIIHDGILEEIPPLTGHEESVLVNGKRYEAFITSGGCSTLVDSWNGRVSGDVVYKTLRYPGHYQRVNRKCHWDSATERLEFHEDFKRELIETTPLFPIPDLVAMLIEVVGEKNGKVRVAQFSHELVCPNKDDVYWIRQLTAIQRMTAASVASVLRTHLAGKIKESGYLKQEEIDLYDFLRCGYRDLLGL